jgi:hypothetical protein
MDALVPDKYQLFLFKGFPDFNFHAIYFDLIYTELSSFVREMHRRIYHHLYIKRHCS